MKNLFALIAFFLNPALSLAQEGSAFDINSGQFILVTNGVFALNEGNAMDLTTRNVLLAVTRDRRGCLSIRINGELDCPEIGQRYDLKWRHAPFHLDTTFADAEVCNLDVIGIEDSSAGEGSIKFRLNCELSS